MNLLEEMYSVRRKGTLSDGAITPEPERPWPQLDTAIAVCATEPWAEQGTGKLQTSDSEPYSPSPPEKNPVVFRNKTEYLLPNDFTL